MKNVLGAIVLLVAAFLLFVTTRPGQFHVERSTAIAAPRETVFASIDDLNRWRSGRPGRMLDPR